MKKFIATVIVLTLVLSAGFAQNEINPEQIGKLTAQQKLKEISVSKMEDTGLWYGIIPADHGFMSLRTFFGGSNNKEVIEDEQQFGLGEKDERVVGAKIEFYHRGAITFSLKPTRPLPIEGITKTISVWVAGRNTEHKLELTLADQFGNHAVIPMGKLNFSGWKKLTVTVPVSLKQRDYHYNDRMGVSITGFNIVCNVAETYGKYYIYFDDIRAVTDLFAEESRDSDDMIDAW